MPRLNSKSSAVIGVVFGLPTVVLVLLALFAGTGPAFLQRLSLFNLQNRSPDAILKAQAETVQFGVWGYCIVNNGALTCNNVGTRQLFSTFSLDSSLNIPKGERLDVPNLLAQVRVANPIAFILYVTTASTSFLAFLFMLGGLLSSAFWAVGAASAGFLSIISLLTGSGAVAFTVIFYQRLNRAVLDGIDDAELPPEVSLILSSSFGTGLYLLAAGAGIALIAAIFLTRAACIGHGDRKYYQEEEARYSGSAASISGPVGGVGSSSPPLRPAASAASRRDPTTLPSSVSSTRLTPATTGYRTGVPAPAPVPTTQVIPTTYDPYYDPYASNGGASGYDPYSGMPSYYQPRTYTPEPTSYDYGYNDPAPAPTGHGAADGGYSPPATDAWSTVGLVQAGAPRHDSPSPAPSSPTSPQAPRSYNYPSSTKNDDRRGSPSSSTKKPPQRKPSAASSQRTPSVPSSPPPSPPPVPRDSYLSYGDPAPESAYTDDPYSRWSIFTQPEGPPGGGGGPAGANRGGDRESTWYGDYYSNGNGGNGGNGGRSQQPSSYYPPASTAAQPLSQRQPSRRDYMNPGAGGGAGAGAGARRWRERDYVDDGASGSYSFTTATQSSHAPRRY
ncbi:hypothetical protein HK102_000958 [Quaeritorhiza haematococci]|nr:hypothetical protein HK102_000958 [Quaeritorhiza haematococci]